MAILVTGGEGYIGSHCVTRLAGEGHEIICLDLAAKRNPLVEYKFYQWKVDGPGIFDRIFAENEVDCVVHLAAWSVVPESMADPLKYYHNNVVGTLSLLEAMAKHKVGKLIYSSTASVYGIPKYLPLDEEHPINPISVYASTKHAVERMIHWVGAACGINYVIFRYANAAGAHPSGKIGEAHDPETHIIPIILNTARSGGTFKLCGDDYNTKDGTCIRDYVHVDDLARAHGLAYKYLAGGCASDIFNLGSGVGTSNLEILQAARRVTGLPIPHEVVPRRPGDPDAAAVSGDKAARVLGWDREFKDIDRIIASAWKWHNK